MRSIVTFFSCIAIGSMLIPAASQDFTPYELVPLELENPLCGDVTENVRYVVYKCEDAKYKNWIVDTLVSEELPQYISVIYKDNGQVYLRDLLKSNSSYNDETYHGNRNLWIKGQLSDDESEIIVPVGQMYNIETYLGSVYRRYFQRIIFNDGEISLDDSNDCLILNVNGDGSLTAKDADSIHGWGNTETYQDQSAGYDTQSEAEIGSQAVFRSRFVPIGESVVLPPPGLLKQDYQMKYIPFDGEGIGFGDIAKRLKVVTTEDSIYVQGCSYINPEAWIRGVKEDETYVFRDMQFMAASKFFMPSSYHTNELEHTGWSTYEYVFTPDDRDAIFRIDRQSCVLSYDGGYLRFGPTDSVAYHSGDSSSDGFLDVGGDLDILWKPSFEPIPDSPQYPQKPTVSVNQFGDKYEVKAFGSYFDTNGHMLDVRKLYYRLYIDGKPLVFTGENSNKTHYLEESTSYMLYDLLHVYSSENDLPRMYDLSVTIDWKPETVEAELIYIQDGKEYSSSVAMLTEGGNSPEDESIYDLLGRRVSPESLTRGIYIKGGKKFVVR